MFNPYSKISKCKSSLFVIIKALCKIFASGSSTLKVVHATFDET